MDVMAGKWKLIPHELNCLRTWSTFPVEQGLGCVASHMATTKVALSLTKSGDL